MSVVTSDIAPAQALLKAFELSANAIVLYDRTDHLIWANQVYRTRFMQHGLSVGATFEQVLRNGYAHGDGVKVDSGDIDAFVAAVLARRRSKPRREFATDLVDGTWLWVNEDLQDDGSLLCTLTDITSLKRTEHALARAHADALQAARTDPLTGAATRAWLLHLAEMAHEACLQNAQPMAVVLIDLDEFKKINDTHGHAAGDAVLKHFVAHCKGQLRPQDQFGRIGGEEFLLVLPHTRASDALLAAERLRQTLAPADTLRYTFSAGVAGARQGEVLADLLKRADAALYQAKRNGRNHCVEAPAVGA
ncbi:MAG: hypothetical protein RIQ60_571 [Pseudomonadota bacterium]|jgi:diguanylate cyclase (GGDEF)-like protein